MPSVFRVGKARPGLLYPWESVACEPSISQIWQSSMATAQQYSSAIRRFTKSRSKMPRGILLRLIWPGWALSMCGLRESITCSPTQLPHKAWSLSREFDEFRGMTGAGKYIDMAALWTEIHTCALLLRLGIVRILAPIPIVNCAVMHVWSSAAFDAQSVVVDMHKRFISQLFSFRMRAYLVGGFKHREQSPNRKQGCRMPAHNSEAIWLLMATDAKESTRWTCAS